MRLTVLLLALLISNQLFAQQQIVNLADNQKYMIQLNIGKRLNEELKWNIGDGSYVLSELTYRDIESSEIGISATYRLRPKMYFYGFLNSGDIKKGEVQDSDYCLPGRESEFSRSISDVSGDLSDIGVGLAFDTLQRGPGTRVVLSVAFEDHRQNLVMTNGVQIIDRNDFTNCLVTLNPGPTIPPGTAITGLRSTYDVSWFGPVWGAQLSHKTSKSVIGATAKLQTSGWGFGEYDADGYWNLRGLRFNHEADALGLTLQAYAGYKVLPYMELGINFNYYKFAANTGDELLCDDVGCSQLNGFFREADWDAWSMGLTMQISDAFK